MGSETVGDAVPPAQQVALPPEGLATKLAVQHVTKVYRSTTGRDLPVLKDLSFTIEFGEVVSVIGPSGCGKTTLLNVIAGLTPPTSGVVLVDGKPVTGPGSDRGVVFQQDAVFLWRKVRKNVEFGLEVQGVPRAERKAIAERYLDLVRLGDFADFYPKELSGGMKKRVAIAMVLANQPEALLMDEPFGSLDYPTKVGLQHTLLEILAQERRTTVFVTHDIEEALFLSDRIIVLVDGQIDLIESVEFPKPRVDALRGDAEFQRLKMDLWRYLV